MRAWITVISIAAVLVAGCARRPEATMTNNEDTRRAARRFYEIVNQAMRTGDMAALDRVIAPAAVDHDPVPGMAPGREGIKRAFADFRATFPDYRADVDDLLVEGDKAACRITGRMSHRGQEIAVHGIDILRFEGGLVVDRWGQFERLPE
jgi:predicted SnoaL-like aldol condensation-catalyzing enzyme